MTHLPPTVAPLFDDRAHAGRALARVLEGLEPAEPHLLAIPSGGVAVAAEIARSLGWPLSLLIVRKVQLPWTTEAGFGAVTTTGEVVLNEEVTRAAGLTAEQIETQVGRTRRGLEQRQRRFGWAAAAPNLSGRTAILVDDGLASGITMLAAARSARTLDAGTVWAAVPVAHAGAVRRIEHAVDRVVTLHVDRAPSFAVASFYRLWWDLSDDDVAELLAGLGMAP